jgi:iron uptake system EfeUOB component EfeO/EfeM
LQNSIDPAADYLEKREQDAGFTGFHRIEYGLFAGNTTDGLQPAADRLLADVTTLKARLGAVKLAPDDLTQGAARLARRLADGRIERGENAYAHSDLADLDASLAGLAKMARLVRPLIPAAAADLAKQLDGRVDAVRQALAAFKSGDAYPSYERVDAAGRRALAGDFRDLADTLDTVSARLSPG